LTWLLGIRLKFFFYACENLNKDLIRSLCVIEMNKTSYSKLASSILVIHGCIELLALLMFVLPPEFIPIALSDDISFWGMIGAMYGIFRIAASVSIAKMKKNGIVFGIILSTVTIAVAPYIQPFGLIDLPLSVVVLWALLTLWFGGGKIED